MKPDGDIQFDRDLILVVDDDRDFVDAVVNSLGADLPSAKFLTAGDGQACLSVYKESNPKPGIIILDMMLPGKSGFLVLQDLEKAGQDNAPPVVIMVTGNQGARHKVYAKSLGTFRYLNKPFRMQRLLEVVQDARSRIS